MDSPLILVIIPTFNEPALVVAKSIRSVLSQSYTKWELLIVDDGTDVETKSMVDSFQGVDYLKFNIDYIFFITSSKRYSNN